MTATAPTRTILYVRLSDLRSEDLDDSGHGKGLVDQERRLRELAARRGWPVARVVVENDIVDGKPKPASAFKRRKVTLPNGSTAYRVVRPGFRSALDDLAGGRADALLAVDLDRAMRDPRDLEDLLDAVEQRGLNVDSLTGSLRFTNGGTDAEITQARIFVTMANKSSRDTARRVRDTRERQALNGQYGGGARRPFGFERDGVTVRPAEAAELVRAATSILKGIPLRSITRDLRERGVPTVTGTTWAPATLRDILLRPRNAGIAVHRGEEVGPGKWPAILAEDVWRGVVAKLTDPNRTTTPGPAPRWLGSGIFYCGAPGCGQTLRVSQSVRGAPSSRSRRRNAGYRCPDGHVTRIAAMLDAYVTAVLVERLSRPDAVEFFAPAASGVDVAGLRVRAVALRQRLDAFATDYADEAITRAQMLAGTKRVRAQLEMVDHQLATATHVSPAAEIVGAPDVDAVWSRLPLGERRAIVREVLTVTVLPAPKGPGFREEYVRIEWRTA